MIMGLGYPNGTRLTARFPTSAPTPANGYESSEDRKGDLAGGDCPQVESDRALDPSDDIVGHSFLPQGLEVVARVTAAADKPDEARLVRDKGLEGLNEVLGVVVRVHCVHIWTH